MKALITGIAGSGGSYLAEHIAAHYPDVEIEGIARNPRAAGSPNLAALRGKVKVHACDLNDFETTSQVLRQAKPQLVFHLASNANVRQSFDLPREIIQNNVLCTLNLFEAVRMCGADVTILHCSTSEVYGQVAPQDVPIKESTPMRPVSPYAASKVAQDMMALAYFKSYGMKIIRTRMFTYLNPRRADLFATAFALQVARIERGLQNELLHGNLESVRTFIDVRDAMEAYWLAAKKGVPGEVYNIGGGTTKTVGEFLEVLKSKSTAPISTRQDPSLLRPADVTLQIPDVSRFVAATGWKPRYSFEQSVDHLLEHCRAHV